MPASRTIEIAQFNIAPGVALETLLAASERLEREFLSKAPGYLGRVLAQLDETHWADIVHWRTREDAEAILPAVPESAACRAYFSCMVSADPHDPAAGVAHFHEVRSYGALAA